MFGTKKQKQEDFVWKDFRDKSYEELEQEVDAAYRRDIRIKMIKYSVVAVVLMIVFHDVLGFWAKFGLPRFTKQTTDAIVNVMSAPEYNQLVEYDEYGDEIETEEIFEYLTLEDNQKVLLRKRYASSLTGCVVAKNFLFWGNYLPKGKRVFQSAALFDLGLAWGKLANENILKNYEFYSQKDKVSRALHTSLKFGVKRPPMPWPYVKTHLAHVHIVPANADVMNALIYLRKYQPVRLEGYLVDMQVEGKRWVRSFVAHGEHTTRKTREIMYVTRVQVGQKIYE